MRTAAEYVEPGACWQARDDERRRLDFSFGCPAGPCGENPTAAPRQGNWVSGARAHEDTGETGDASTRGSTPPSSASGWRWVPSCSRCARTRHGRSSPGPGAGRREAWRPRPDSTRLPGPIDPIPRTASPFLRVRPNAMLTKRLLCKLVSHRVSRRASGLGLVFGAAFSLGVWWSQRGPRDAAEWARTASAPVSVGPEASAQ